jgi:hypothetical protein
MRSRATGEALRVALVDGAGREVAASEQRLTLSTRASASAVAPA